MLKRDTRRDARAVVVAAFALAAFALAPSGLAGRLGAAVAGAQDFWAGKDYRQWTKEEATRVLNASPWVKTQEVRVKPASARRSVAGQNESNVSSAPSTGSRQAELGGAEAPVDYKVTLRLRSALPVRQALVRLRQLEAKYDKMGESQRAAFDADKRTKGLLECPACAQNYVVTMSARSVNVPGADFVYEGLKSATLPLLRQTVYLANERGERRELVHFTPPKAPGEEAMFFFPRLDDAGKPLFAPGDRKILFRTSTGDVAAITNFEFDISALLVGGEVAF